MAGQRHLMTDRIYYREAYSFYRDAVRRLCGPAAAIELAKAWAAIWQRRAEVQINENASEARECE